MTNQSKPDLPGTDFASLTPAQWVAFKRHIIDDAKRARAQAIRESFGALFAFLGKVTVRAWHAIFTAPPVFPSHRT